MELMNCQRCNATTRSVVMEMHYTCKIRRCPMRRLLDAKEQCWKTAWEASGHDRLTAEMAMQMFLDSLITGMEMTH